MRLVLIALLAALPVLAAAAPPKGFDARVESVMKDSGVPGAWVSIVEDGKVTLASGYGIRALGSAESVDADTLFQIGSTTKAFTAAALAILVEDGKLGWDDRVIDHLPGLSHVRPLGHARDHGPRPAGASQRPRSGPGRPDVRAFDRHQPRGPGAADPVPQAEDQLPLGVRVRQRALRRRRPGGRGNLRTDLGRIRRGAHLRARSA